MSFCQSLLKAVKENAYNLSRPEFALVRKYQRDDSITSRLDLKACLKKIRRADLTTFDGIIWVNAFLDLIYVMVIFKIDEILNRCSHQYDRFSDLEAAVNVYIVAISFFVLMFFTRYQMDNYCASFMQLTATSTYPLLQSDMFHRMIVGLYGLGMFIMTMNINLAELHIKGKEHDSFVVGSCKFVPQYAMGFAEGFFITRGLMCLLYVSVLCFAKDPVLVNKYRSTFAFRTTRNFISMVFIAGLFASSYDSTATNQLNVVLLTFVALIEVLGEFFLVSTNRVMAKWFHVKPTSRFYLQIVRFDLQPRKIASTKTHQNNRQTIVIRNSINIRHSNHNSYRKEVDIYSYTLFCDAVVMQDRLSLFFMLVLGESFLGLLYLAYDPNNESAFLVQVLVYFLVVSTGTLFFETVDKQVHTAEDDDDDDEWEAEQNRNSSQLAIANDIHNRNSDVRNSENEENEDSDRNTDVKLSSVHQPSSVSASTTENNRTESRIQEDLKIAALSNNPVTRHKHRHGLLAKYPFSHFFVWMHVVVSFTLLLATCGIVGLYANSTLTLPTYEKSKTSKGKHNTTAPTLQPTLLSSTTIPTLQIPLFSSPTTVLKQGTEAIVEEYTDTAASYSFRSTRYKRKENNINKNNHYYPYSVLAWLSSATSSSSLGYYSSKFTSQESSTVSHSSSKGSNNDDTKQLTSKKRRGIGEKSKKKNKDNNAEIDADVVSEGTNNSYAYAPTSYDDSYGYYYYYYDDDTYIPGSLNQEQYPSLSLSEWQMAIGLSLTSLGCMFMRLLHRDFSSSSFFFNVSPVKQPGNEEAASSLHSKTWNQHFCQFYQYYFLELMTVMAAIGHLLVYAAFHHYHPASDATFLLFSWHTMVNVALSMIYLFQRLTVVKDSDHEHTAGGETGAHGGDHHMEDNPIHTAPNRERTISL